MPTPLFADGDALPQWLVIALAICSGPVAVFCRWAWKVWRAKQADRAAQAARDHDHAAGDRKQARREKTEDEKALDRQRDKLWERVEQIEAKCREENEDLQGRLAALYRHIMVERTLVGRWMGKVSGWMDYAAAAAKQAGIELPPREPPPDLPDPPDLAGRAEGDT